MKQKLINHHDAIVHELFFKRKETTCVGCDKALSTGERGVKRIVTERMNDLAEGKRDRLENLRLVHFCCRRKSKMNDQVTKARQLRKSGKSPVEIAEALHVSLATTYRYIKEKTQPFMVDHPDNCF